MRDYKNFVNKTIIPSNKIVNSITYMYDKDQYSTIPPSNIYLPINSCLSPESSMTPINSLNLNSRTQKNQSNIIESSAHLYECKNVSDDYSRQFLLKPYLSERLPTKKAVIVGLNYVLTPDILLRGGCNDAIATALTLVNLCDFAPENIILLIDSFPNSCYSTLVSSKSEQSGKFISWKDRQPSRRNILLALNWLRSETIPGDVLFFYFAGHGIQVDDMSGWEGEGYDEAILPMDFYGEEVNAITAVMIRNILLNVSNDVQITIVLDCNGGQTMLDPTGTGKWSYIKGVKQRGVWPLITDATDKMARAIYDSTPWTDKAMKRRGARPRFVPGVDVNSTQELLDPTLQKANTATTSKVRGFMFAAAPWSQCAIEAKMSAIKIVAVSSDGKIVSNLQDSKQSAYHGTFTWCFINALIDLIVNSILETSSKKVTFKRLIKEVEYRINLCRTSEKGLPKLNQKPELTFYRSGGSDCSDFIFWPFGGSRADVPYSFNRRQSSWPWIVQEQQFLSTWEAEEQLRCASENKRRNDPTFHQYNKSNGMLTGKNVSGTHLVNSHVDLDKVSKMLVFLRLLKVQRCYIHPLNSQYVKNLNNHNILPDVICRSQKNFDSIQRNVVLHKENYPSLKPNMMFYNSHPECISQSFNYKVA